MSAPEREQVDGRGPSQRTTCSRFRASACSLGYTLLAGGDVGSTIKIFRFNARAHPVSANAQDSLGEAYLAAGRLEEAEAEYLRTLELDPSMDSSRRGLRKIADRRGGRR